jgi:hypothetical protein
MVQEVFFIEGVSSAGMALVNVNIVIKIATANVVLNSEFVIVPNCCTPSEMLISWHGNMQHTDEY